jgi:hypothetical protein
VLMLAFISWNENNNGFDLVGLNFFFLAAKFGIFFAHLILEVVFTMDG